MSFMANRYNTRNTDATIKEEPQEVIEIIHDDSGVRCGNKVLQQSSPQSGILHACGRNGMPHRCKTRTSDKVPGTSSSTTRSIVQDRKRQSPSKLYETAKESEPYECLFCNGRYVTAIDLEKHTQIHFSERESSTQYCEIQSIETDLKLVYGKQVQAFECTICFALFRDIQALRKHVETEHCPKEPIQCSDLESENETQDDIRYSAADHSTTGHRKQKLHDRDTAISDSTDKKTICRATGIKHRLRHRHVKTNISTAPNQRIKFSEHRPVRKVSDSLTQRSMCNIDETGSDGDEGVSNRTQKRFVEIEVLNHRNHNIVKTEAVLNTCDPFSSSLKAESVQRADSDASVSNFETECLDVPTSQRCTLSKTNRNVHKITRHQCSYCGKKCTAKHTLQAHIDTVHGEVVMARHVDSIHRDIRHVCPYCAKAFHRKDHLKSHIMKRVCVNRTGITSDEFKKNVVKCVDCKNFFRLNESRKRCLENVGSKGTDVANSTGHSKFVCSGCRVVNQTRDVTERLGSRDKLQCNKCFDWFSSSDILACHFNVHSYTKSFHVCVKCGVHFSSAHILKRHNVRCGMRATPISNTSIRGDIRKTKVKRMRCEQCFMSFASSSLLKRHMSTHIFETLLYPCSKCNMKFSYKTLLDRHIKVLCSTHVQTQVKTMAPKTLWDDSKLIKALKKLKRLECTICNKVFNKAGSYRGHMKLKHDSGKQHCDICGKLFADLYCVKLHKQNIHFPTFECPECPKVFGAQGRLNRHMLNHKPASFPCEFCGKCFHTKQDASRHAQRIHVITERKFPCDVCSNSFKCKDSLIVHKATHSGVKSHVCKYCEKGFTTLGQLKNHGVTHVKEKNVKCHQCYKTFKSNSQLRSHMVYHAERKFKCKLCDDTFFASHHLKYHMLKHSGERMFQCAVCGKAFGRKQILNTHMLSHTGERPFMCSNCDKTFARKCDLNKHNRKTHDC